MSEETVIEKPKLKPMCRLTKEQIDQKKMFIDNYIQSSNASTGSLMDANANVAVKTVATLGAEVYKDMCIQINRSTMKDYIEKYFDKETAEEYIDLLEEHTLYKHDETCFAPGVPYCVAISMYPFLEHGMTTLGGESKAPKHLESFCGSFINLCFAVSSQFAGACLYKDQKLIIRKNGGSAKSIKIKDLIEKYKNRNWIPFYSQGYEWYLCHIEDENLEVFEDGKFVKLNKLYKRKYSDKIYNIKTKKGSDIFVSKDHKFNLRYKVRNFTLKADELQIDDTVQSNTDFSLAIDKNSFDYKQGQCIGIIAGDGCITEKHDAKVSVHEDQQFIMDFLDESFEKYTGVYNKKSRYKDKRGKCFEYYICSPMQANNIRDYFKKDCYNTYTKDVELSDKSLDWKIGFLDGLLVADGSFSRGQCCSIALVNKGLIEKVQQILDDLYIHKNIISYDPKRENRSVIYKIEVPLRVMKYLELTLKKPTLSSIKKYSSRENHVEEFSEVYYIGKNSSFKNTSNITSAKTAKVGFNGDVILEINKFDNDDEFVYEIETSSHWYNCGGLITHNCATVEWLMYFDHFARKDYGDDYLNTHRNSIIAKFQHTV